MPKFLIKWDAGYGSNYEAGEFENQEQAQDYAREQWTEESETNADYSAKPLTQEDIDNYGPFG